MRGVVKALPACLLAVLLAAVLTACGGEDSDDPTAGSAGATTERTAAEDGSGEQGSESAGGSSSEGGSADFRTPGGDNSIPEFGEEADAEEHAAASAAVLALMQARAEGDWDAVCSHLSATALKPLEQLAARSKELRGKECPELLDTLTASTPASTRANTLGGEIDGLRSDGERAFALYHGTDGRDYVLPLAMEDGEWKAGSFSPTELP